jgi:hypothetical protein
MRLALLFPSEQDVIPNPLAWIGAEVQSHYWRNLAAGSVDEIHAPASVNEWPRFESHITDFGVATGSSGVAPFTMA